MDISLAEEGVSGVWGVSGRFEVVVADWATMALEHVVEGRDTRCLVASSSVGFRLLELAAAAANHRCLPLEAKPNRQVVD